MTIGEKIALLRSEKGISQEELAEEFGVSRQSVSKWEMDGALPGIDKILQISDFFGISADALIRPEGKISFENEKPRNKYFGTDGFRGEANSDLNSEQAYKVGRFLGWYFKEGNKRPRFVIGKDTRRSSYMLEYSIVAGLTASGADVYMLHVTTTPSVSYVTRQDEFDAGIMITASHNPYYDNGIKIINRYGEKLDDGTTAKIESYLDGRLDEIGLSDSTDIPFAKRDKIGCIYDYVSGRNRYIGYLISLASNSYKKLKIGLDCANGASWNIASSVFGALGAQVYVVGAEPDGLNINQGCGSTHIENLQKLVKEKHLDLGFAFDGDADRCIAVDENGRVVDGDGIIYVLAKRLKTRGVLNEDTVVATVMSNSGFVKSLEKIGIRCVETTVGDRFVYECMQNNSYSIGGEQSGHIILKKYATTGDGILTAIMIAEEVCDSKMSLSRLTEAMTLYPQYMINLRVKDKNAAVNDPAVIAAKEKIERRIAGNGRVLLRMSGTEPVVRVMTECETDALAREYAEYVGEAVKAGGHLVG